MTYLREHQLTVQRKTSELRGKMGGAVVRWAYSYERDMRKRKQLGLEGARRDDGCC